MKKIKFLPLAVVIILLSMFVLTACGNNGQNNNNANAASESEVASELEITSEPTEEIAEPTDETAGLAIVQNVAVEFVSPTIYRVSWDPVPDATQYQVVTTTLGCRGGLRTIIIDVANGEVLASFNNLGESGTVLTPSEIYNNMANSAIGPDRTIPNGTIAMLSPTSFLQRGMPLPGAMKAEAASAATSAPHPTAVMISVVAFTGEEMTAQGFTIYDINNPLAYRGQPSELMDVDIEIVQDKAALISWDAVAGAESYFVTISGRGSAYNQRTIIFDAEGDVTSFWQNNNGIRVLEEDGSLSLMDLRHDYAANTLLATQPYGDVPPTAPHGTIENSVRLPAYEGISLLDFADIATWDGSLPSVHCDISNEPFITKGGDAGNIAPISATSFALCLQTDYDGIVATHIVVSIMALVNGQQVAVGIGMMAL